MQKVIFARPLLGLSTHIAIRVEIFDSFNLVTPTACCEQAAFLVVVFSRFFGCGPWQLKRTSKSQSAKCFDEYCVISICAFDIIGWRFLIAGNGGCVFRLLVRCHRRLSCGLHLCSYCIAAAFCHGSYRGTHQGYDQKSFQGFHGKSPVFRFSHQNVCWLGLILKLGAFHAHPHKMNFLTGRCLGVSRVTSISWAPFLPTTICSPRE